MALAAGQIPLVANVPNGGVGVISASSNIAAVGVDTNGVDVYVAGAKGGRVEMLTAVTDDTVLVNVLLWILRGATVVPLNIITVPLSSGTVAGKLNVDFLDQANLAGALLDNNGKRYIPLLPNDKLRAGSLAGLTAAKKCWVQSQGSDYQ